MFNFIFNYIDINKVFKIYLFKVYCSVSYLYKFKLLLIKELVFFDMYMVIYLCLSLDYFYFKFYVV